MKASHVDGTISAVLVAAFLWSISYSSLLNQVAHAAETAEQGRPPNVVLIFTDDQGYGDLGCFGATDLSTPHLDRLAREGTRFTSFYVAQPVCTASRAALMTGCYSNRVGLHGALNHESKTGIHPDELTLPEMLKQAGYATACFGKWHLGHRPEFSPLRHGFDEFLGIPYSNDNGPLHPVVRTIPSLPLIDGERTVALDPDQSQFTRQFTNRAIRFIESNRERPFFLYLPQVMPHVPIFVSEHFKGTSRRGFYGDVIHELDWSVGQIMETLHRTGLNNRTLVIFATDNGPFLSYGNHAGSAGKLREGKLTTWEGGVRVPCLMRWPGHVPADKVCDEMLSTIDLLPTLARLCGGKLSQNVIDGVDVWPLISGKTAKSPREAFFFYGGDELQAVRVGRWKLHLPHEYLTVAGPPGQNGKPANLENLKPESMQLSGLAGIASRHGYRVAKTELALYDLVADVGETTNVADQHPAEIKRLMEVAEQARADLGDSLTKRAGTRLRTVGRVQDK